MHIAYGCDKLTSVCSDVSWCLIEQDGRGLNVLFVSGFLALLPVMVNWV